MEAYDSGSQSGGAWRLSRRRFLLGVASVAGGVAVPAGARADESGGPGREPVTLTVATRTPGYAIPSDFAGLSFERGTETAGNAGVVGYFFSPSNAALVTLFRNLGIRSLRIGGGSVDDEIPAGMGSDGYTGVDNLFDFARVADVKVLYSLRLLNPARKPIPNLRTEDAAIAKYIWDHYRQYLSSFAIGNEPDWHSYHTSTGHMEDPRIYETTSGVPGTAYPSYLADWRNFAGTILGLVPEAKFSGPDTGCYGTLTYTPNPTTGVSWTQQFAGDEEGSGIIADITQHYYVGGGPGRTTTQQAIDNMLSTEWVDNTKIGTQPAGTGTATTTYTPYPWLYQHNIAPVVKTGLRYRLTESNDYLGGVPGASNGYASALWTLDYMHWWAAHRAAGVNFHNKQWIYTDTIIPDPNPCQGTCGDYQIAPKGYGIKAFDVGGHGFVKPVTISSPDGINLTAYAVARDRELYVTIINKTQGAKATDAQVRIVTEGSRAASAAVMILTNGEPGNASRETVTLGGDVIRNDRRWHGRWTPLHSDTPDEVTLTIQATTAAIVRIQAVPREVR